jgi:hypothetical protein
LRAPRFRFTIRGLMSLVLVVAVYCGFWAWLRAWEARRPLMYLQQEATRAIIQEPLVALNGKGPGSRVAFLQSTKTREWSETVTTLSEPSDGSRIGSPRARVSGSNGNFALNSIKIEVFDPAYAEPWLDRLLREYRSKGWRFEVIMHSEVDSPKR